MVHIVDTRGAGGAGGEFVVLGDAFTLPSSDRPAPFSPSQGSLRFNPNTTMVEVYTPSTMEWVGLGGSGPIPNSTDNLFTILSDGEFLFSHSMVINGNLTVTGVVNGPFFSGTSEYAINVGEGSAIGNGGITISNAGVVYLSGDATGDGVSNIAVTLATVGTAGTYTQVVTDVKGRVISGGNPDITITGDVLGSGYNTIPVTLATVATPGTYTEVVIDAKGRVIIGSNPAAAPVTTTLTGDVTGSGVGNVATTLVTVGTSGTYTQVVTDSKGRVISGANPSPLITVTGDVSGSGIGTVPTVLATISTPGTYTEVVIDAKGRVTSGSNPVASIPSVLIAGSGATNTTITQSTITFYSSSGNTTLSLSGVASTLQTANQLVLSASSISLEAATVITGNLQVAGTGSFSGTVVMATPPIVDNSNNAATTAWVIEQGYVTNSFTSLGYIPQGNFVVSGDVTGTATLNAVTLTLNTVNTNVGTFGGSLMIPVMTVNAKGLITAVYNSSINFPSFPTSVANATYANSAGSALVATTANVAVTQPLSDNSTNIATTAWVIDQGYVTEAQAANAANSVITITGDVSGSGVDNINLVLANVVSAGTYTGSIIVDSKGRVIGANFLPINISNTVANLMNTTSFPVGTMAYATDGRKPDEYDYEFDSRYPLAGVNGSGIPVFYGYLAYANVVSNTPTWLSSIDSYLASS